ncbi:MAG: transcriptional regulator [Acetobacteraceae bacterium]
MTDGLSHQLWRLSEAGEPVVMLGRQHAVGEDAAFERLIQLGILLHRGREASWDVCSDCDCGADERAVVWDGDVATAKCVADYRRDERLDADDVRSFSVVLQAFMEGVAAAMGLGRPEQIGPGVWSFGLLADGRIIVVAPTRAGIRQPGLVGSLRLAHREGTIVLVGPELPALVRGNLAAQNIHHVQPIHALPPSTGDNPLALDIARLPDGLAGNYRLILTTEARTARLGGKEASLPPRPFQMLRILALQHRRGKPIVSRHILLDEIFTPSTDEAAVRDLLSELRKKLIQAFGDADDVAQLITTHTTAGYAINLPPLTVSVAE